MLRLVQTNSGHDRRIGGPWLSRAKILQGHHVLTSLAATGGSFSMPVTPRYRFTYSVWMDEPYAPQTSQFVRVGLCFVSLRSASWRS